MVVILALTVCGRPRRRQEEGARVTSPPKLCQAWHAIAPESAIRLAEPRGRRLALAGVEHDLSEHQPHAVRTRFELAIQRMIDAWMAAGRLEVSPADVKLAREFLEYSGWKVEDGSEGRVRIVDSDGQAEELSREDAVMAALRRLARK